jgi:hypothetical protein
MKKSIFIFITFLISITYCNAQYYSSTQIKKINNNCLLKEGTPIVLEIIEEVRSDRVEEGTIVKMRVFTAIKGDSNIILVKERLFAYGKVVAVSRAGAYGKGAYIEIQPSYIQGADGSLIEVESKMPIIARGEQHSRKAALASVVLPMLGGVFVHGTEAVVASGTLIDAIISENTFIKP